jgi:hypothetical protein
MIKVYTDKTIFDLDETKKFECKDCRAQAFKAVDRQTKEVKYLHRTINTYVEHKLHCPKR